MVRPTKFRKIAAGGLDQGDNTLNNFGMVPVTQKSVGVSAVSTNPTIAIVPDDGADILEIFLLVDDPAVPSAATVKFGTSASNAKFGQISVSGTGRYTLPLRSGSLTGDVHVAGSAFAVTANAVITAYVSASSVGGGNAITGAPSFVAYTTFLQNKTTDF